MKNSHIITLATIALVVIAGMAAYARASSNPSEKLDGRLCTMDYAPVCGVGGITYGNRCMAGNNEIAHDGECLKETTGTAMPVPGTVVDDTIVTDASGTFLAGSEIPALANEDLARS